MENTFLWWSNPTVDRISNLPDSILCHILSFLPTKQAAATTSLVSKRWEKVWLSILALDFNDEAFKDFNTFRNFVNSTMFEMRDKETSIHSFNIKCGKSSHFKQQNYKRIFKTTTLCGVQTLNFDMSDKLRRTKLPSQIFNFKMLQVLKLRKIYMEDFDQVNFPHLKTLHLNDVVFISHEYIEKFVNGCPILENFEYQLYFKDIDKYHISGLYTPLTLVSKAKILQAEKVVWMSWTELPIFHNVTYLEFSFDSLFINRECWSLPQILQHFPKLQHLNIQDCASELSKCFKRWKDPPFVSECLSSQLKTCFISGYRGREYEFGFAKYILQHSKVLETMTIKSIFQAKVQMLMKLLLSPFGSTSCKIIISR